MSEHHDQSPRPPEPAPEDFATWLVAGYDRHPAAQAAVVAAADLATRLDARLLVVHVLDVEDYPIDPDADVADWEAHARAALAHERDQVHALLAEHRLPWTWVARRGNAARELLDLADEHHALMIVLGVGRAGLTARLLGDSVATYVTRHTDRPVLLVPEPRARSVLPGPLGQS
ncbi:universal stress protein [Nonomuraea sp. NPDC047897]|uniref:universal stress protein n=1 Tax=Nonomuraea sp. NPDC047897 TaxID=3364346 RepID=UPI003719328C